MYKYSRNIREIAVGTHFRAKKNEKTFDKEGEIWYYSQAVLNCMRSCWNWQTGMTKDHVSLRRVGSSPILRIDKMMGTALDGRFLSLCMDQ